MINNSTIFRLVILESINSNVPMFSKSHIGISTKMPGISEGLNCFLQ